jgi:hypothetical protein
MATFLPGVPRLKGVDIKRWNVERDESFSLDESPEKVVEVGDPSLVG